MYLLALETSSPENRYTQRECHAIFLASQARSRLRKRSRDIMEKVLERDNGIAERGFCFPEIASIFDAGPGRLNAVFEQEAPRLGAAALDKALAEARLGPADLDGLVVCTCTGYLCPGLSSFVAERCGLRADAELVDLVGMGCGAAIPSVRQAAHMLGTGPDRRIAVVAVEVCSAAFYLDDDPGVIISACLFGDGAAAAIWTGRAPASPAWHAGHFESLHLPDKRQLLRFENAGGALRNRLHKSVPGEAAAAVRELFDRTARRGLDMESARFLPHTGGRDVLDALEREFPGRSFPESRAVLHRHGNMSSPSILFVLKEFLNIQPQPATSLWLTSFGAGFTAYGMSLTRM